MRHFPLITNRIFFRMKRIVTTDPQERFEGYRAILRDVIDLYNILVERGYGGCYTQRDTNSSVGCVFLSNWRTLLQGKMDRALADGATL